MDKPMGAAGIEPAAETRMNSGKCEIQLAFVGAPVGAPPRTHCTFPASEIGHGDRFAAARMKLSPFPQKRDSRSGRFEGTF
jgi:hypothetical protein